MLQTFYSVFFFFLFYLSFNDKAFLSFRCDTMCFVCQIWNLVLPIQDPYLHSAICHSINWSAFSPWLLFLSCYRSLFTRTQAKSCVAATWISRLLESGIFLGLNFVFIMNIFCLFLAFFTLSPYIYILSITLEHEKKIVSLQVVYPDLKRWDIFWQPLNLPTTSSEKTVSGLSIKVNWTLWASSRSLQLSEKSDAEQGMTCKNSVSKKLNLLFNIDEHNLPTNSSKMTLSGLYKVYWTLLWASPSTFPCPHLSQKYKEEDVT